MQSSTQFQTQPSVSGLTLVELDSPSASVQIVGVSAVWRKLLMQAEMAAPHLQVAALEGEPGSGKYTLARYLFSRSPLASTNFQRRDAREWLATDADPSTLAGFTYLDRVDLLAPPGQGLLLGVLKTLQDRPAGRAVLLASSQTSLRQMAGQGLLLPDLAFRLTAIRFAIPPLRQRREDIAPLAQFVLDRLCARYQQRPVALVERNIAARVMIPAYARPAHRRLRRKLAEIARWNEAEGPTVIVEGDPALGAIATGICYQHVCEALPGASICKPGMTYPLPIDRLREFAARVGRCLVVEEGDPYLADAARAAGIAIEAPPEAFRFGELNVARVRRMAAHDQSPEPQPSAGKPPELCPSCPHRAVFTALRNLDCIVAGDIGCYSLGVLPPFQAMDTLVCMGAALGVGLGMRHVLPPEQARRVVSVIGDSTFVHSGITGLVEMVYNPPPTGHVVMILDNGTTAMTGMQEHPGTGRTLDHHHTGKYHF